MYGARYAAELICSAVTRIAKPSADDLLLCGCPGSAELFICSLTVQAAIVVSVIHPLLCRHHLSGQAQPLSRAYFVHHSPFCCRTPPLPPQTSLRPACLRAAPPSPHGPEPCPRRTTRRRRRGSTPSTLSASARLSRSTRRPRVSAETRHHPAPVCKGSTAEVPAVHS